MKSIKTVSVETWVMITFFKSLNFFPWTWHHLLWHAHSVQTEYSRNSISITCQSQHVEHDILGHYITLFPYWLGWYCEVLLQLCLIADPISSSKGAVLGMSLRKVTTFGSNLASVTDLKRIQTPHSLCCDFRGDKTFTTYWSGCRVQVSVQVWAPACHLAIGGCSRR